MNEEILYNELYERTKEFGRTQFVRLLLDKEREIKELKEKLESSEKAIKELLRENKELSHIVANKVISDYDIDTPLKKELIDARLKIISLEDALHCYKQEKEDLIKWLKNAIRLCNKTIDDLSKPHFADEIEIEVPMELIIAAISQVNYLEVLDKVRRFNK